jgi:haloalkane dehalogenase
MLPSVSRGYFDLPWGQMHFRTAVYQTAKPGMILLHQTPLSSRNYEPLLPHLTKHCRPYAIDTPGYGGSSKPAGDWEVADYAKAVWNCADQIGAEKVVLFGRATGAVFAVEAALLRPERVHCLILHGMPVYTDEERAERMTNFAPPIEESADGAHLHAIWDRIKGEYPWIGPELATHFVRDFMSSGADFASSYRAIWRYNLPDRVRDNVEVPTFLIGGSNDRIAYMHERAVALIPQAQSVYLDGVTDFVAEQNPSLFAGILIDFMTRHIS